MGRVFYGRLLVYGSPVAGAADAAGVYAAHRLAYLPAWSLGGRLVVVASAAVAFVGPGVGIALLPRRTWRRVAGGCLAAVLGLIAFVALATAGELLIRR